MKYLSIKPRTEKLSNNSKHFSEFEVSKINGVEAFIEQRVGKAPVKRVIGDYVFWISDPKTAVDTESGIIEIEDTIDSLIPNLLLNEAEIAYGEVIITANSKVSSNDYEGLTDVDIGYIMNAFTNSSSVLIEDDISDLTIAVDKITESLLSPNGVDNNVQEDVIPDFITIDDEEVESIDPSLLPDIKDVEVQDL